MLIEFVVVYVVGAILALLWMRSATRRETWHRHACGHYVVDGYEDVCTICNVVPLRWTGV